MKYHIIRHFKACCKASRASRTFWLGHIVAILGIVQVNMPSLRAAIPTEYYGCVAIVVAVAIYIIRAVTTDSIHEK